MVGAALVAYAGMLELLQNILPGRHAAIGDWLAGSGGALLGIWVARFAPVSAPGKAAVERGAPGAGGGPLKAHQPARDR